jgi:sugar phosphate isomerase/epimerase
MKFGAMNFPVKSVLEEIETFARLGFDYVELAMDPPMAHHSILYGIRSKIRKALEEYGMGLVCHLPTFVTTADLTESLREASVAEMHRSLEVATLLGTEKAVLHPSVASGMGAFVLDTVKGHAFDFFSRIVDSAAERGIIICLENMFPRNGLGVEPDDFEEIFTAFPSFRLTLDTGHANIGDKRGKRLRAFADRFGDRIGHLHFSDNKGKLDDHLAIGQGAINFNRLIQRLKITGYDDTLTLEVFDTDRTMLVKSRDKIQAMLLK